MQRCRFLVLPLTLALPLATACGDFDRHDDRLFDFPATPAPAEPHPTPYVPEEETAPQATPAPAALAAPVQKAAQPEASQDKVDDAPPPAADEAAEERETQETVQSSEEQSRPPVAAPRKNVGMRRNKLEPFDGRRDKQILQRDRARALDGRRPARLDREDRLSGKGRVPPRGPGSGRALKKTPLSSARDGD